MQQMWCPEKLLEWLAGGTSRASCGGARQSNLVVVEAANSGAQNTPP